MAKRRYNAKKIAQTPSLKRKIAEFIANKADKTEYDIVKMLTYGHRGYISYSEDGLCKLFDKLFSDVTQKYNERVQEIYTEMGQSKRAWQHDSLKKDLERLNKAMDEYKELANEIFEEKILL